MIRLYKNKKTAPIALLLAVVILISAFPPLMMPSLFTNAETEPTVTTKDGYANPYIAAPVTGLSAHPTFAGSNTAPSNTITNDAQFIELAQYSQTHDLTGEVYTITKVGAIELDNSFCGIGSALYPFKGTLQGGYQNDVQNIISIANGSALFNYLSSSATINKIGVISSAVSPASNLLAENFVLDSGTVGALSILSLSGPVINPYSDGNAGMLFGNVINGSATGAVAVNMSGITVTPDSVTASYGNAGGLIGKVTSGSLTLTGNIAVSSGYTITANGGNAGGLVGAIAAGAALTVNGTVSVTGNNSTENITAKRFYSASPAVNDGGNAGAVCGSIGSGGVLTTGAVTITNQIVGGGSCVGGAIGTVTGGSFTPASCAISGSDIRGGVSCGGYIGELTDPAGGFTPAAATTITATLTPTNDLTFGNVGAGGLFGSLQLNTGHSFAVDLSNAGMINARYCDISGSGTDSDPDAAAQNNCFGGLVGIYSAASTADSFTVTGGNSIKSVCASAYQSTNGVYCYGGVVGMIKSGSYCALTNVSESHGSDDNFAADAGNIFAKRFGGICGKLYSGAILDLSGITVNGGWCVKDNSAYAGGIVGYTDNAAVVRFANAITLGNNAYGITSNGGGVSEVADPNYADFSGQLVGYQDYSLIYGEETFALTRNNTNENVGYIMDDIGNYGEVYRDNTDNIISINAAHAVSIGSISGASSSAVSLGSKADYMRLAITLNTHGAYSAVAGVTSANYAALLDADITLLNSINLDGTGVVCLTRNDAEYDTFTGSVNGGSNTLKLAIGEVYGSTGLHGNGEIYGQPYLGMFAVTSNASVQNLTLEGTITCGQSMSGFVLSNDRLIRAGGITGSAVGSLTLNGVTASLTINEKNSRNYSVNYNLGYYGGLVGYFSGNTLELTSCTGNATINKKTTYSIVTHTTSYATNNAVSGGLIGAISDTGTNAVSFTDTTLTGNITVNAEIADMQAGGLVGTITSSASTPTKPITINGITVNNQRVSGANATASCGALLGYLWDNVTVSITKTSGSNSITGALTSGTAVFGGLFYEIKGKLDIEKTNIAGSFSGAHTGNVADGLLVCQGDELYAVIDSPSVVITSTVTESGGKYCDDLVGNSINTNNNQRGGIVSIQTDNGSGTYDSIGSTAHPWVYNTNNPAHLNPATRYYYNVEGLDTAHDTTVTHHANIAAGHFTCKEDLLLWHILNYTNHSYTINRIKYTLDKCAYFFDEDLSFPGNSNYTATADIDLTDGFCQYPTLAGGGSYDFGDHTLSFGNNDVNSTLPTGAKSTNSTAQHYLMQTGLFTDVRNTLSVSNLVLAGDVGMWNNSSGALITGTVTGSHSSGSTTYTVIYLNLTDITLKDLYVNGCNVSNNYAPLLVNKINTCVSANITDIDEDYAVRTTKAGSSLIGDVGYYTSSTSNATHLSLNFSHLTLDGSATSVFYRSSLLNKFSYTGDSTSSGIYNFNEAEDWTNASTHPRNVTYGTELTANETEYYDQPYKVHPDAYRQTSVYDYTANGYIPYVYTAENVASNLFELDVNIKGGDLTDGCGTYEDPYQITRKQQLLNVLGYVNSNALPTGWQVNAPNDSYCEGTDHTTHTAGTASFSSQLTRSWFAHAYYQITENITFESTDNFTGFGTIGNNSSDMPFAGVIIGTNAEIGNHTITIPAPQVSDNTQTGFINGAAGCVLKDLNIVYSDSRTVSSTAGSYFGGAIGKVLGGDNIIDNVTVTFNGNVVVSTRNSYTGGFVGLLSAGGVVFRNMNGIAGCSFYNTSNEAIEGASNKWFYANPYVGRALDGYAIAEPGTVLDNTNKNYKINTLSGNTGAITISNAVTGDKSTGRKFVLTTINNAEGLFVLAATLNCGGQSVTLSKAYFGEMRVRNASYANVGNTASAADSDRTIATNDNLVIEYNTSRTAHIPYLSKRYFTENSTQDSNYLTGNSQRLQLALASAGSFDMSDYGNGFRGIGSVYNTNANTSRKSNSTTLETNNDRTHGLTEDNTRGGTVVSFNGNGRTVKMNMNMNQYYSGEQYAANSLGLFNILNIAAEQKSASATFKDISLTGSIELHDYNTNGTENTLINSSRQVGGLYGSVNASPNASYNKCNLRITNVTLSGTTENPFTVYSPGHAGGISAKTTLALASIYTNCGYNGIYINGRASAGGIIGSNQIASTVTNTTAVMSNATIKNDKSDASIISSIGGVAGENNNSLSITGANIDDSLLYGSNIPTGTTNAEKYTWHLSASNSSVGGVVGISLEALTIADCSVDGTTLYAKNNCAGLVGEANAASVNISDCSVGTESAVTVIGTSNATGAVGYSKCPTVITNVSVGNATTRCMFIGGTRAAGFVGNQNGSTLDITNVSVTNSSIICSSSDNAAATCGGLVGGATSATVVASVNTASITDCSITSVSGRFAGGAVGRIDGTVYMNDITISGNGICATGGSTYPGGVAQNVSGTLYGNNILWKNNMMGITASGMGNIQNGTAPIITANTSSAFWVKSNSGTVSLMAISRRDATVKYTECGGNPMLVYADYYGTVGADATVATLGAQIPLNPVRSWSAGNNWQGDGVIDGQPIDIFTNRSNVLTLTRYDRTGALTTLNENESGTTENAYMKKVSDYITGTTAATADLPLLYVKGDANALITDYLDLLTNGGYTAIDKSKVTASGSSYTVTGGSIAQVAAAGSIAYANGEFTSAQNYDSVSGSTLHFTVVRVSFENPSAADVSSSFSTDFAVYYPQILSVNSYISMKDHEEYNIPSYKPIESSVNITDGGRFSALIEYDYNELRTADNWNYEKYFEITELNNRLPEGTKLTLVDISSGDPSQYIAYYKTLTAPIAATDNKRINLADFIAADGTTHFAATPLQDLPDYASSISLADTPNNEAVDFGMERYIIVFDLPLLDDENNPQYVYTIQPGLDPTIGNQRNVELNYTSINQRNGAVTVWNEPTTTTALAAIDGAAVISRSSPVEARLSTSITFPPSYIDTVSATSSRYGVIRYYITSAGDSTQLALPADSIVTINGASYTADGASSFHQTVLSDANGAINLLTAAENNVYSFNQTVAIDFSNVAVQALTNIFHSGNYTLHADFYITSDADYPTIGQLTPTTMGLTANLNNNAALTVNVDGSSLLHLGINPLDPDNETNNGIINYHTVLNLAECSDDEITAITGGNVILTFNLFKKGNLTDGVYPYNTVNPSIYLNEVSTGNYGLNSITLTADDFDPVTKQYNVDLSLHVKASTSTALADFANYKLEVTATLTGENNHTLRDHFIYTLAKIPADFVN